MKKGLVVASIGIAMLTGSAIVGNAEREMMKDSNDIQLEVAVADVQRITLTPINELYIENEKIQQIVQDFIVYDIPLDKKLQRYTYDMCEEYGIEYEMMLAVMDVETGGTYNPKLLSKTNDIGLCQINKCNWEWLAEAGLADLKDPRQNINAGCIILGGLVEKYGSSHRAVMAYNMGRGGASKVWKKGFRTSRYSRKVFKIKESKFDKNNKIERND